MRDPGFMWAVAKQFKSRWLEAEQLIDEDYPKVKLAIEWLRERVGPDTIQIKEVDDDQMLVILDEYIIEYLGFEAETISLFLRVRES